MMSSESKQTLAIKRYIKNDLWDDFWKDIIDYEDLLDETIAIKNNHTFSPLKVINIPKHTKVLRPGHYITFLDRVYYFKLLLKICAKINQKLVKQDVSYSYRLAVNSHNLIENNIDNWLSFVKRQEEEFNKKPNWIMVETDISAFFEHIVIAKLINRIKILGAQCDELNILLKSWSGDLPIGIPQGNDASSYLANVYLDEVDRAMIDSKFTYFRFTDDIRIFVENESEAEKSLIRLTQSLRPLNLHLNSAKTKLINKSTFESEKNKFEQTMVEIEYGLEMRKLTILSNEAERLLLKQLKIIFNQSISTFTTDERNFKFCINRFHRLNSNYPKRKILQLSQWSANIVKTICEYLINQQLYNDNNVRLKLFEEYNKTNYEYVKIWLLRCLIFAKPRNFEATINLENDLKSNNFLLRGHLTIFVFKFLNETKQNILIEDIISHWLNDHEYIRYAAIATNFIIDPQKKSYLQKIISAKYPRYSKLFSKNIKRSTKLGQIINGI